VKAGISESVSIPLRRASDRQFLDRQRNRGADKFPPIDVLDQQQPRVRNEGIGVVKRIYLISHDAAIL
jgi:hypothetical protein